MKHKPAPSALPHACALRTITNGGFYQWPTTGRLVPSVSPKPYSIVVRFDHVVVKVPSSYGFAEYEKYVVREDTDNDAIRCNETIERFQNLDELLSRYHSFREARTTFGDKRIHWLLLQILQYDRLKQVIAIPETRYCFFSKRGILFKSTHPGLIQEHVNGISLWDMIDHEVVHEDGTQYPFVRQEYEPLIPQIASQLGPLITPQYSCHINWHIKNFIVDPTTRILYYLDLKPSTVFGRWRNEQNLRNIRRDFVR